MKLKLNKSTVMNLSNEEMVLTKGGGYNRSTRLNTHCNYSENNLVTTEHEVTGGGCVTVESCKKKS